MNIGRHFQSLANILVNSRYPKPGTKLFTSFSRQKSESRVLKDLKASKSLIRRCLNEAFVTQPLESQVISDHLVLVTVSELRIESRRRSLTCMGKKGLLFICRQSLCRLSASPSTRSLIGSSRCHGDLVGWPRMRVRIACLLPSPLPNA